MLYSASIKVRIRGKEYPFIGTLCGDFDNLEFGEINKMCLEKYGCEFVSLEKDSNKDSYIICMDPTTCYYLPNKHIRMFAINRGFDPEIVRESEFFQGTKEEACKYFGMDDFDEYVNTIPHSTLYYVYF